MTLVSQIITDAFRQGNLIAIGQTPTPAEQTEALRYLNRIVKSVLGNEVGDSFTAFPIGSENISRPAGYPWWRTVPDDNWFVPPNIRVMLNLPESVNLYLHPQPREGARFAAIDVAGNLSTYPVTVHGNGRLIEGATSITLNTDDTNSEWFYRGDTANWVKYSPLQLSDTFPFPEEFDKYFITMLAMEINPSQGVSMDQQVQASFQRSRTQIRARYSQITPVQTELALIKMPKVSAQRDDYANEYFIYDPNSLFDRGWNF